VFVVPTLLPLAFAQDAPSNVDALRDGLRALGLDAGPALVVVKTYGGLPPWFDPAVTIDALEDALPSGSRVAPYEAVLIDAEDARARRDGAHAAGMASVVLVEFWPAGSRVDASLSGWVLGAAEREVSPLVVSMTELTNGVPPPDVPSALEGPGFVAPPASVPKKKKKRRKRRRLGWPDWPGDVVDWIGDRELGLLARGSPFTGFAAYDGGREIEYVGASLGGVLALHGDYLYVGPAVDRVPEVGAPMWGGRAGVATSGGWVHLTLGYQKAPRLDLFVVEGEIIVDSVRLGRADDLRDPGWGVPMVFSFGGLGGAATGYSMHFRLELARY